ncbi:hypothetical protein INT44_004527 [Umbelopsis vinacea]|uniref:Uncharacterized protein n=1 Tax=Umbelopsis vinacea TaxID=44442 RepID=A0A8H7QC50_9FUNG|nr:hypothetical protein INT44_004527 [Umbelopsis vinacea]
MRKWTFNVDPRAQADEMPGSTPSLRYLHSVREDIVQPKFALVIYLYEMADMLEIPLKFITARWSAVVVLICLAR